MKRLLVVNPNTTAAVTDLLASLVGAELAGVAEVSAVSGPFGAAYISTEVDYAIAAHAAIEAWRADRDRHGEADAVLIGCFGDPGVFALRELTSRPVIGLAEAAIREASMIGRYVIVTGGDRWPAMLRRLAVSLGLDDPGDRIVALTPTGGQLAAQPQAAVRLLGQAAVDAIRRHDARSVILGGAGLASFAPAVAAALPVPLVDSVRAGARAAAAMLRAEPS